MSYFRIIEHDRRLRVVVVGAGQMGRRWITEVLECEELELSGVVDIDLDAARRAVRACGAGAVAVDAGLSAVLARQPVDAVINVTVPESHFAINLECLRAAIPVLCEKPLVPSLTHAYLLAGAAEHHSTLLAASQSRRYYRRLSDLRRAIAGTGPPFLVTAQFFRDPHFGGFRQQMVQPLLLDMAIHAFDTARFLTASEPVSARCETFNPSWSWYEGDAAAVATFEMTDGLRFAYTGSWCSGGLETSWNGSWRLSGPRGSATWDGIGPPALELVNNATSAATVGDWSAQASGEPEEMAGSLAEFVRSLRSGAAPSGDIHANLWTLAMVHAAVQSASTSGRRVVVSDLMDVAFRKALADEDHEGSSALHRWGHPLARLIGGEGGSPRSGGAGPEPAQGPGRGARV